MTSEDKLANENDVMAVTSGELADKIATWLDVCAIKELEPRCVCTTGTVTLKAGDRAWNYACTPESMKTAMMPFKSDARFQRAGVKRNGFTSCMYLLSHPKDVPYVANGHTRTNGSAQTAGNTETVHLGSVARAQAALDKAVTASEKATAFVEECRGKLLDAQNAEQVRKLEADKATVAKEQKAIEDAKTNRAALLARAAKLQKQIDDMNALLAKTA
jgi:hypothetical protein